jgi:hypothetical protein
VVEISPEWVMGPEQGNTIPPLAEGIMADLLRDFWIRETETGQQVAQLNDRYVMMMTTVALSLGQSGRGVIQSTQTL